MITGIDGLIQDVNPAFERLTGYGRDDVLGQNPRILKSGQHDVAFYQQMWETIRQGDIWHGAFANRRKDGTLYYVEETISPVRDDAGKTTAFVAAQRDVTERKRAEDALRDSEARYRAQLERTEVILAETKALYEASKTLIRLQSLPDLLQDIVNGVAAALPANRVSLFLVDQIEQRITKLVRGGPRADLVVEISYDELLQGLSGWVMQQRQPALSLKGEFDTREMEHVRQRHARPGPAL